MSFRGLGSQQFGDGSIRLGGEHEVEGWLEIRREMALSAGSYMVFGCQHGHPFNKALSLEVSV